MVLPSSTPTTTHQSVVSPNQTPLDKNVPFPFSLQLHKSQSPYVETLEERLFTALSVCATDSVRAEGYLDTNDKLSGLMPGADADTGWAGDAHGTDGKRTCLYLPLRRRLCFWPWGGGLGTSLAHYASRTTRRMRFVKSLTRLVGSVLRRSRPVAPPVVGFGLLVRPSAFHSAPRRGSVVVDGLTFLFS